VSWCKAFSTTLRSSPPSKSPARFTSCRLICQLFADLIEHWERRGKAGLEYMDPKKLDRPLLAQLVDKYGYQDIAAELKRRDGWPNPKDDELDGGVAEHDDYAACKITRKEDWVDLYARPFYFGCEADDRMNAVAFGKVNPFGARINAIFSSDVGHFDVPDMRMVLPEAHELVEGRADHRRRLPRLHLRLRRGPLGYAEPGLLCRHRRHRRRRRGIRQNPGARRGGVNTQPETVTRRVLGAAHRCTYRERAEDMLIMCAAWASMLRQIFPLMTNISKSRRVGTSEGEQCR
jgi:hypothetical protein